jgi:DNA-binding PadR family transcriptional regulator
MDREELKKTYLSIVLGHLASGEEHPSRRLHALATRLTPSSEHRRGVFYVVLQWTKDMGLATSRDMPDEEGIVTSVFRITSKGLDVVEAILSGRPITVSWGRGVAVDPGALN